MALGRVVRGMSAIFWGIPAALIVCLQSAKTDWLGPFGHFKILAPLATTGLLFYGLKLLGDFQRQERVWQLSLERAKLVTLVAMGFSPFVCWWQRFPEIHFFMVGVAGLGICGWVFIILLNQVLVRLAAMLPDETLREETRLFGVFNLWVLGFVLLIVAGFFWMNQKEVVSGVVAAWLGILKEIGFSVIIFFCLIPVATTMALVWKIKETIFHSVFH